MSVLKAKQRITNLVNILDKDVTPTLVGELQKTLKEFPENINDYNHIRVVSIRKRPYRSLKNHGIKVCK